MSLVDAITPLTVPSSVPAGQATVHAPAAPHAQTANGAQDDTVEISADFQAVRLYEQGQSEAAIAHALNTTTRTVDGYLGLTLEKELQQTLQPPAKS